MEARTLVPDFDMNFSLTEEDVLDSYEQTWSKTYDQDVIKLQSKYHDQLVQDLCKLIPEESRGEVQILDIAAGTGLVGHSLHQAGFKIFDAVDMSPTMLDQLRRRNLYRHVTCARIGDGHTLSHISDQTYDIITIAEGFVPAHLPVKSLLEVSRLLKPGGFFINVMIEYFLDAVDELKPLEPLMKDMEVQGIWQMVKRQTYPELALGRPAVIHVFKKS